MAACLNNYLLQQVHKEQQQLLLLLAPRSGAAVARAALYNTLSIATVSGLIWLPWLAAACWCGVPLLLVCWGSAHLDSACLAIAWMGRVLWPGCLVSSLIQVPYQLVGPTGMCIALHA